MTSLWLELPLRLPVASQGSSEAKLSEAQLGAARGPSSQDLPAQLAEQQLGVLREE